eukprot:jgi/Mesen1/4413/ME000225S03400
MKRKVAEFNKAFGDGPNKRQADTGDLPLSGADIAAPQAPGSLCDAHGPRSTIRLRQGNAARKQQIIDRRVLQNQQRQKGEGASQKEQERRSRSTSKSAGEAAVDGQQQQQQQQPSKKKHKVAARLNGVQSGHDSHGRKSPQPGTAVDGRQFMLDMICDIKNNRKRSAASEEPASFTRLKKWLSKLRVEDVQLRAVTWQRLLEPGKKGQWWLPGPAGSRPDGGDHPSHFATTGQLALHIDADVAEADRMLQLAASQRMNTDARRAVFCVIMSGEDYLDAFEKLLRLRLPGKQEREIERVVVDCCLQERTFNRFYALLAARLATHHRHHKFTLQYCIWDHFKELPAMELRRSVNLGRMVAHIIGSFALPLSVLKAVEFNDPRAMTPKVVFHFRVLLESLLTEFDDKVVWAAFSRIAAAQSLTPFRDGLSVFVHQHVQVHALQSLTSEGADSAALLLKRCKLAKKALSNVSGTMIS